MNPVLFACAALAGGLGAVLRWAIEVFVARHTKSPFPWGVLVVNITGSLALGILTGSLAGTVAAFIIGTGFLGGYTTFSSVAATTALMLDEQRTRAGIVNALGTFTLSVIAAGVGLWVGRLLV